MKMPSTILAAVAIAAGAPLLAGSAIAAPLSTSMALKNSTATSVEHVQWRRGGNWRGGHWRGGRWIGPAVGAAAAGAIIGGALAAPHAYGYYDDSYNSYAYSPGRAYGPRYRYRSSPQFGDYEYRSAYPSWNDRWDSWDNN